MTRPDESVRSRRDAVLAEHRALRQILVRMRGAQNREEILAGLLEFRTACGEHFAGEEAPGGFYESVVLSAPRHQSVLEELRDEHGLFLREADELLVRAKECPDADVACVREQVQKLAAGLDTHEARENEILLEVMNTDLGAGD